MISYGDITEEADRRWTARLLARLDAADLPDDELDELVGALQAVSDPRSFAKLEKVLVDPARPTEIREAAASALRGMQYAIIDVPEDKLRRWWQDGDAVLRRHALSCMDAVDCPDIVLQLAADPSHELHAAAIGQMEFFFELPEHQRVKIAALSHPDPEVRAIAAGVLLWDEPVSAELPLIEAARDPVPEVAAEAANTLGYYPTVQVIRRLHELLGHADEVVREEAEESLQSIREELLDRFRSRDRQVADRVRRWLRPVWDILAFSDEELLPDEDDDIPPRQEVPGEATPVADLLALLSDPDASPRILGELLWSNRWPAYGVKERRRLRPVLLTHPDQLVRERAALALASWQDADRLLELVRDGHFLVRKAAMFRLGLLPPTSGVADIAWEHLNRPEVLGVTATEALVTFVKHAEPADAVRRLGWIAGDHGRSEGLRVDAVHHLADLGAAEVVGQLAGQLLEPPAVTWALHIALLDAVEDLGLATPDIGRLLEVDNLHVQEAVARVRSG